MITNEQVLQLPLNGRQLTEFNLLNRVQLAVPIATLNSPNFGVITSTAGDARIVQLALRCSF